jgi:5-methyltetrahydrofolate--homocysteine methyltransferase
MFMGKFETYLQNTEILLADGAMGTMLFEAGLGQGDPPQAWNLEHPDRVASVHRQYLEAGARLLLTNTFGANRFRMALHETEAPIGEMNLAAAEILRSEIEAWGGDALIAGDIGPSGAVLAPYGELIFEELKEGFQEQAAPLIEGGVDLIWIETMSDLEEVRAAMEAVRQISKTIPIIATMTFDTRGHTMMGVSPEQAADSLNAFGATVIGGNCGNGTEEIIMVIDKMRSAVPHATLAAKANAGIPRLISGKAVYEADSQKMADYARKARASGARIIGACCGSTPEHIKAMAKALELEA